MFETWREWTSGWADWAVLAAALGVGVLLGWAAHAVVWWLLARVSRDRGRVPTRELVRRTRIGGLVVVLTIALRIMSGASGALIGVNAGLRSGVNQALHLTTIIGVTFLIIGLIQGTDDILLARYRIDVRDNLKARRMHTQVRVLSRAIQVVAVIVGLALALMSFDGVRQLGTSLLASAGIAGLAIGLAARPVLENLIAGIQIAITQPISLDDVVIIDGEWGWIEEITTTYVVVRVWDQRRLIVPFSKVIEQPFQNWTRRTSEMLGTVFIRTDYTAPLDKLRAELERTCRASEKWDKRVCLLQVTDAGERTLELRALISASDSPALWDLRCQVREALVVFLQQECPGALPRVRLEPGAVDGARSA